MTTPAMDGRPDPEYSAPRVRVPAPTPAETRAEFAVGALFVLTMLAGLALLVVYLVGGGTQLQGLLLTLAFAGIGAGIVIWAQWLLPTRLVIEDRHPVEPEMDAQVAAGEAATREAEAGFTRRHMLIGLLFSAVGGLGAALVIPVLSLGPAPGRDLFVTAWKKGSRVVGLDGKPVHADQLAIDGVLTVFPEGAVGDAMAQTLLIRVPPDLLRLPAGRMAWAPDGYVAYSKVCTHAGCPVGLYRASQHRLICPCHQSTFDVLDGARPTFGPAARPLPQLPIQLQPDGTFVALDGFPGPVGPSFWNMTSEGGS
jgi:quinol---cytochrome c reductase iron-sulfur subunit